jgi:hypothetical protein
MGVLNPLWLLKYKIEMHSNKKIDGLFGEFNSLEIYHFKITNANCYD